MASPACLATPFQVLSHHPSMNSQNIILTGFMGCGKTTVGRILASRLGYRFVDTDRLIEERCAMTVAQLFAKRGEAAFRLLERAVAEELGRLSGLVVATGGKLMLDADNASLLGKSGHVFCLTAPLEDILSRVGGDGGAVRPLLQGDDPRGRISRLLEERREGYGQFAQVATGGRSAEEVAAEILRLVDMATRRKQAGQEA